MKKFDKPQTQTASNFLGSLYIKKYSMQDLLNPRAQYTSSSQALKHLISPVESTKRDEKTLYPNLVREFRSLDVSETRCCNGAYFKRWKEKSQQSSSDSETLITISDFSPVHLTSFRNFLFCMNQDKQLQLYSINTNNKIELKNLFKINVPNIRSIAANISYFAVSYAKCKANDLTGFMKNLPPNGVLLFKRDLNVINSNYEKSINFEGGLAAPAGLAMTSEHLYLCDKELRCLFKIDIENEQLVNRISLSDGEPSFCAINQKYLVLSDTLKHRLIVYDIETFNELNKVVIEQQDGANGPFNLLLTEDNSIFYKNYADSQLVLTDVEFNQHVLFKNLKSGIFGICVLQCGAQHTLVVTSPLHKNNQFKFITFSI